MSGIIAIRYAIVVAFIAFLLKILRRSEFLLTLVIMHSVGADGRCSAINFLVLLLASLVNIGLKFSVQQEMLYLGANDPTFLDYQIAWIHELPSLLILLDDKYPSCSKVLSGIPVLL